MNTHLLSMSCLLSFFVIGCQNQSTTNAPSNNSGKKPLMLVKVQQPERRALRSTTKQPVTLHAYYEAEIYAKVSGYLPLETFKADIGLKVKKDDILGIIDVPEMKERMAKQEALIKQLQAEKKFAEASVEVSKADLKAASALHEKVKSDVTKSNAQMVADKRELDRVLDLIQQQAAAQRLEDEARYRYQSSKSAKESAEADVFLQKENIAISQAKLDKSKANVEITEQQVEVAKKALQEMKTMMDFATLKAPFAGTVVERHVEPGDLVRNSEATSGMQKPLFVIADLSKIRARVPVPERDTPYLRVGAKATVDLLALKGRPIPGTVSRIAGKLDDETRTMLVEIDLENPDRHYYPGMFGTATIELQDRPNCLVLPAPMVRYDDEGKSYVFIVDSSNKIQMTPVATGLDDGQTIEIVEGLTGNEQVVAPTARRLKVGQEVRIVK